MRKCHGNDLIAMVDDHYTPGISVPLNTAKEHKWQSSYPQFRCKPISVPTLTAILCTFPPSFFLKK